MRNNALYVGKGPSQNVIVVPRDVPWYIGLLCPLVQHTTHLRKTKCHRQAKHVLNIFIALNER